MIKTKADYKYYLEADRIARGVNEYTLATYIKDLLFPNYIVRFQKTLRKLEFYRNCRNGTFGTFFQVFVFWKYRRLSHKLGFSIPPNVFGPGLSIAHYGTIVVNGGAKVGSNCRLHACVNIGTEAGFSNRAPSIGDNCYIGPGVKIYGEISIANGIAIGANAVVNKSFSETNIAIAGVPAKKIGLVDTKKILIPATDILDANLALAKIK